MYVGVDMVTSSTDAPVLVPACDSRNCSRREDSVAGRVPWDVVIIGGCGRVGLPLGIAFAAVG